MLIQYKYFSKQINISKSRFEINLNYLSIAYKNKKRKNNQGQHFFIISYWISELDEKQ